MSNDKEKRFVCVLSGSREYPNDIITVYKEFNTEAEAGAWLNEHRLEVVLFRDDELGLRSKEEVINYA